MGETNGIYGDKILKLRSHEAHQRKEKKKKHTKEIKRRIGAGERFGIRGHLCTNECPTISPSNLLARKAHTQNKKKKTMLGTNKSGASIRE